MSLGERVLRSYKRALDGVGETVTLRRKVDGSDVDVVCRARVDGADMQEIAAGISQQSVKVIISASEILDEGWPGVALGSPPYNPDPRVPREGDQIIVRGRMRRIEAVEALYVRDVMVRINLRATG